MKSYPFHLIAGDDKGYSYSSFPRIGDILAGKSFGQAQVDIYANVANGNLAIRDHALIFSEISEPVTLAYYYNSQVSSLASAWRLPVKSFKPPAKDAKQIVFTEEDGHQTLYQVKGELFCAPGLVHGTPFLKWNEKTQQWWRYSPANQVSELYDSKGCLLEKRDAWGNKTFYDYDSKGGLQSIRAPSGKQYLINSSIKNGQLYQTISVTPKSGGAAKILQGYLFSEQGLLIESITSLNGMNLDGGYKTTYRYVDSSARLFSIIQDDGSQIQFNYKSSGCLKGIDLPGQSTVTRMDLMYSAKKVKAEISGGWLVDIEVDDQSRFSKITRYADYQGFDKPETTSYQYHPEGQIAKILLPDGSQETYDYLETYGLITVGIRPNGQETRYSYDISNYRPLQQSQSILLPESKQSAVTYSIYEPRPAVSDPADEKDYLRYIVTPEGSVTNLMRYPNGLVQYERTYTRESFDKPNVEKLYSQVQTWVSKHSSSAELLTQCTYDDRALVTERRRYANLDSKGNGIADEQMSVVQHQWDDFGRCLLATQQMERDQQGHAIEAESHQQFDGLQRLLHSINPVDEITDIKFSKMEDKPLLEAGVVYTQKTTLPNGRVETLGLNSQGDKVLSWSAIQNSRGEWVTRLWQHFYDAASRLSQTVEPDGRILYTIADRQNRPGFSISPTGLVTEHRYDNRTNYETDIEYATPIDCKLLSATSSGGDIQALLSPSLEDRTHYRFFDSSKRLRYEVDAKNQVIEYRYNSLDQRIAMIEYADPLSEGQLAALKQAKPIQLPLNLEKDHCLSTYYNRDNKIIGEIDADGWVVEYLRDGAGNVRQKNWYCTPNRSQPRSDNFADMRPAGQYFKEFYFRNARGQEKLVVNSARVLSATVYYASELPQQTMIYYTKVSQSWFDKNYLEVPAFPAPHSEDYQASYQHDLCGRMLSLLPSNGPSQSIEYSNMNHIALKRDYDSQSVDNSSYLADGDSARTIQYRFDGWENTVQIANVFISQQLARIDADEKLSPDQKQADKEAVWKKSSQHDVFDDLSQLKIKSTNTLGFTSIYYYDREKRLVLALSPQGAVIQFTYNHFHNQVRLQLYFNPISAKDLQKLNGGYVDNDDGVLRLLVPDSKKDSVWNYKFNKKNERISIVDPEGYLSNFIFNAFGDLIQEEWPLDSQSPSLIIQRGFNGRRQEISKKRIAKSGEILTSSQSYVHCRGGCTEVKDEAGAVTQYGRDSLGNLNQIIDALGIVAHQYKHDAFNRVVSDKDASGQEITVGYSQQRRCRWEMWPVPGSKIFEQSNVFGQVICKTDALGSDSKNSHAPSGQSILSINELGWKTEDHYDSESQAIQHIDPNGTLTQWELNGDGYTLRQIQNQGSSSPLVTVYSPDAMGRMQSITNPLGMITQQNFDRRSLLQSAVRDVGSAASPGLSLIESKTYNGQKTKTRSSQGDLKDDSQYVVSFQQDVFNRSVGKVVDPGGLNLQLQLIYNPVDKIVQVTDPKGRMTRLCYDQRKQRRFVVNSLGQISEWQYNDLCLQSYMRRYDAALSAEQLKQLDAKPNLENWEQLAATIASSEDTLTYSFYDGNKREQFRVQMYADPEQKCWQGIVLQNVYDAVGHLIRIIHYAQTIDASKIATMTTEEIGEQVDAMAGPSDRYTYLIVDAAGQQRFSFDSRGVLTEKRYDRLGREIMTVQYAKKLPQPAQFAEYTDKELSDYVAEQIADVTEDRLDYTQYHPVFIDKPQYIVKTHLGQQCRVIQYLHDKVGNLLQTCQYQTPLVFTSQEALPQQLAALKPDPSKDRIEKNTLDLCNRTTVKTDPLGYKSYYTHDALDSVTLYKDRRGKEWRKSYDRAKRLTASLSPVTKVSTLTEDKSGQLSLEFKERSVKTSYAYDKVNNVRQQIIDDGGDDPRVCLMDYIPIDYPTLEKDALSVTTVEAVEVDDPSQVSSLTQLPVKKKTVQKTTIFNAKSKPIIEINENGARKFSVYDSMERVAYQVNAEGAVMGYQRNSFGEVVIETQYATRLKIDLKPYRDSGIPITVVVKNLIESVDDRYAFYDRDLAGNPSMTYKNINKPALNSPALALSGRAFYYHPQTKQSGVGFSRKFRRFDAFNQIIYTSELIVDGNPLLSKTYRWFNASRRIIAQAEAVYKSGSDRQVYYRIERTDYDVYDQEIKKIKFAQYFDIKPEEMSFSQLCAAIGEPKSPDRITEKTYDLRGSLLSESKLSVDREDMALDEKNQITFKTYPGIDVAKRYAYDAGELRISVTHEALPDQKPLQEFYFHDARGYEMAHTLVPFIGLLTTGVSAEITPLVWKFINAHGQLVITRAFANGAKTVSGSVTADPLSPDDAKDRIEFKEMDNRGKERSRQDANGHRQYLTYTPTGQLARQYGPLTNTKKITQLLPRPHYEYQDEVHLDEVRNIYDVCERPSGRELRRDNGLKFATAFNYNAFGESIQEGPGSAVVSEESKELKTELSSAESPVKESKEAQEASSQTLTPSAQWPVYRVMDGEGRIINSNSRNNPGSEICFYDLRGYQTASLRSAKIKLSEKTMADFPALLAASYTDVERTEFWRDRAGRLVAERLPDCSPPSSSVLSVPLTFLVSDLFPPIGKTSLTWEPPVLNAEPFFYCTELETKDAKKMLLPIVKDAASGRYGVDLSGWKSSHYHLEIEYYRIDPISSQPDKNQKAYRSEGDIDLRTLPIVKDDHCLWLPNPDLSVLSIALLDEHGESKEYKVTEDKASNQVWVDLAKEPSGRYTANPRSKSGAGFVTPPFVINSDQISSSLVSREIPAIARIALTDSAELLIWDTLPLDYRKKPVELDCVYVDSADQDQKLSCVLTPDEKGKAQLPFKTPIKSVQTLSIWLVVSETEKLPIYLSENPEPQLSPGYVFSQEPKDESELTGEEQQKRTMQQSRRYLWAVQRSQAQLSLFPRQPAPEAEPVDAKSASVMPVVIGFPPRRLVYIRGEAVKGLSGPVSIQYRDIIRDLPVAWTDLAADGVTDQGIVLNVSLFPPGHYPFILPNGDPDRPEIFSLTWGGQVFESLAAPADSKTVLLAEEPEPWHRMRLFELDTFDNAVMVRDAIGNEYRYAFDDRDLEIKKIDPAVLAVDEKGGENSSFVGVTLTHHNIDGAVIGWTKPLGNQEGIERDSHNRRRQHVLGEGTVSQSWVRNGFSEAEQLQDSRGYTTTRSWDRCGYLIQQVMPTNQAGGLPLTMSLTYNERGGRRTKTDPGGAITRWNVNVQDDPELQINPLGDQVERTFDRNHLKLWEVRASGLSEVWTPDPIYGYMGIMKSYKGLGDDGYDYTYDEKLQKIRVKRVSGAKWPIANLTQVYKPGTQTLVYSLDYYLAPYQHLNFNWVAGRLMNVMDYAQVMKTCYDYNAEDDRILMQLWSAAGTRLETLTRDIRATFDSLRRSISFSDSIASGITTYDGNGNRRRDCLQMYNGLLQKQDSWNAYDAADRITAADCELDNGELKHGVKGYFITYEGGVRVRERSAVNRAISYHPSGDIAENSESKGFHQQSWKRGYARSGYQSSLEESPSHRVTTIFCDLNLFQKSETVQEGGDIKLITNLSPNADDEVASQLTTDDQDDVSYELTNAWVGIQGDRQLTGVSGKATDKYGRNYTQLTLTYDANGSNRSKWGDPYGDGSGNDNKPYSTYFTTAYDGMILTKLRFPGDPAQSDGSSELSSYFYDPDGNYRMDYGSHSSGLSFQNPNYSRVRNRGHWGQFGMAGALSSRQGEGLGGRWASRSGWGPGSGIRHLSGSREGRRRLDRLRMGPDLSSAYVEPINHLDILAVPDTYTVQPGDSYSSIALSQYGNKNMGPVIAQANGDASENDSPIVGSILKLPQYIASENRSDNVTPYEKIKRSIVGNLYPVLNFAQPKPKKHHSSCGETIVLAAVSVVAVVIAPHVALLMEPTMTALFGPTMGLAIASGVTATLADAAMQGIAVQIGLLRQFSLVSVLEAGISAGVLGGLMKPGKEAFSFFTKVTRTAIAGAVTDVGDQLLELSLGIRHQLDLRQVLNALATSVLDAAVSLKLPELIQSPRLSSLMTSAIDSSLNLVVGEAVMGLPLEVKLAAAQAIGSYAGQELGNGLGYGIDKLAPSSGGLYDIYQAGQGGNDYHNALVRTKTGGIGFSPEPYGIGFWPEVTFDHTPDYAREVKTDSNKAPKSSSPKAPAALQDNAALPPVEQKVAKPNNYLALKEAKQGLAVMLDANLMGQYPGYFSDSLSGVSLPALYSSSSLSPSGLSGWIYENQANWKGQSALFMLQGTEKFLRVLDSYLRPTAEMNPIVSGTNALWGQDILDNNRPLTGWERALSGLNTASFFASAGEKLVENIVRSLPSMKVMLSEGVTFFASHFDEGFIPKASELSPWDLELTHDRMLSKKAYNELLKNIQLGGIENTIKYVEYQGKYYVVNGNHRTMIARQLGYSEVPIEKVELPYKGYEKPEDLFYYGASF